MYLVYYGPEFRSWHQRNYWPWPSWAWCEGQLSSETRKMPGRWWWHANGDRSSSAEKEWSTGEYLSEIWHEDRRGGYCNKGVRFQSFTELLVSWYALQQQGEQTSGHLQEICDVPVFTCTSMRKYFSVTKWLSDELRQYLHKNPQTDPSTCNQLTHVRYLLHFSLYDDGTLGTTVHPTVYSQVPTTQSFVNHVFRTRTNSTRLLPSLCSLTLLVSQDKVCEKNIWRRIWRDSKVANGGVNCRRDCSYFGEYCDTCWRSSFWW